MSVLSIRHRTTYRYFRPVYLQPHRLLLRPRESPGLRVLAHDLAVTPEASIAWSGDVFGNQVATATFHGPSAELVIDSRVELELTRHQRSPQPSASAALYPFDYSPDERADLGRLATPHHRDAGGRLHDWARAFVWGRPTDTLALLRDLNHGVGTGISYQGRYTEGTQLPLETLDRGWGACRDLAVLLVEAARALGFGSRLVSGYLHGCEPNTGPGSTHAWAEIFLPGAGWIAYDPTHRTVCSLDLIPVAVGHNIAQLTPVGGSFIGMTDAYQELDVDVVVRSRQVDDAWRPADAFSLTPGSGQ
jgi:transglutaminase-like putative cysteine protease